MTVTACRGALFVFVATMKRQNVMRFCRFFEWYEQEEEFFVKKLLVLFLVALTAFSATAAIAEGGTFRVGMECNYTPFNWTQTESGEFAVPIEGGAGYADGYDVQIAKIIADGLGKELVIVKTEWDGLPPGVTSGIFDAIIAGMSPTEDRKATLDFSDSYYTSDLVVVVRKDGAYADASELADFSGAHITGQLNTFHYQVIQQIPDVNVGIAMDTFPAMIVALRSGVIDGYVAERPGAEADVMANPDLTYVLFGEGQGFQASEEDVSIAVGLNKGNPLTEEINDILAQVDQETRVQLMLDATDRQPLNAE